MVNILLLDLLLVMNVLQENIVNSDSCANCPVGQSSPPNSLDSSSCQPCPAGTYNDEEGTECKNCSIGKYNSNIGSISESECQLNVLPGQLF